MNKVVQKEAKKCKNYDNTIALIFKKYHDTGADHVETLINLSSDRGNKNIEKEIF